MEAYQSILSLQDDFRLELISLKSALKGMDEVTAAIKRRQAADRTAADTRRAELSETASDQSRPLSVRRLAEAELAALPEYCPNVTDRELAAFTAERETAETAIADLRKTVAAIQTATTEAKRELDQIRAGTAGKAYFEIWENSLRGADQAFEALREVTAQ